MTKRLFLDTNICIYALKGAFPKIGENMRSCRPVEIKIAAIVAAELRFGAAKSTNERTRATVDAFLEPYEIVPFDDRSATRYAEIRNQLEQSGTPIGPNDLLIAATVLANDGTLVTRNTREFNRVRGLRVLDWTQ